MGIASRMCAAGLHPSAVAAINGAEYKALTATGTVQADAVPIADALIVLTGAANAGTILPIGQVGDTYLIVNVSANTLKIYPPSGGKLNGAGTNTSKSIAANAAAICICLPGGLDYAVVKGSA